MPKFFLLVFLSVTSLSAQTLDCHHLSSWGPRGHGREFLVTGNRVFAADGRGATLYDISNPSAIRVIASRETVRPSTSIVAAGDGVAILSENHIDLFDSELNLRDGVEVNARIFAGNGQQLASAGDTLTLWDVSAGRLEKLSSTSLTTRVSAIAFRGTRLFLAQNESFTQVYDTSARTLRPSTVLPVAATAFAVGGDLLYAISGGEITAIDSASTPARIVGRLNFPESLLQSGVVVGNTLFVIDRFTSLVAVDISDPANLRVVKVTPAQLRSIAAAGEIVATSEILLDQNDFTAETSQPLTISRASGPDLRELGAFHDFAGPLGGVAIDGRYAFVADAPMFRVIDLTSPSRPREVASIFIGDFSDRVQLRGSTAIVYGRGNVHVIDVSSPVAPRRITVYRSLGIPRSGAAWAGPYLLEANRASGFHVLDVSDPNHLIQITGLKNDSRGAPTGVLAAVPTAVYIGVSDGIKVADLADPHHTFVSTLITGSFTDAQVVDASPSHPALLALLDKGALRIFSLTTPAMPSEISSLPLPTGGTASVKGDLLYVTNPAGELYVISLADAAHPQIIFMGSGLNSPTQSSSTGGLLAVADTYSLKIFTDPAMAPSAGTVVLTAAASADPRMFFLNWTGDAPQFELQTATDESFSQFSSRIVSANNSPIEASAVTFARIRTLGECADNSFSNTVRLDPGDASRPFFLQSGETIYRSSSDSFVTRIAVGNNSDRDLDTTLSASPNGVIQSTTLHVPAHSSSEAIVTVDPSQIGKDATIEIRATGITAPYVLSVRTAAPVEMIGRTAGPRLLIPGVGAVRGGNGTLWESDLRILCRQACMLSLDYIPFGVNTPARRLELSGGRGELIVAADVVRRLFSADDTNGMLEIRSAVLDDISASATTLNRGGVGSYGERIPAKRLQPAVSTLSRQLLPGIRQDSSARTNVGIVETSGQAHTFLLELLNDQGSVVATRQLEVEAFQSFQSSLPALFSDLPSSFTGTLRIAGDASVVVYASRVDQQTGDFVFTYAQHFGEVNAIPGDDSVRFLPAAGSTPGANNSVWRTALQLTNVSSSPGKFLVTFIPAGGPASSVTAEVELDSFASSDSDDVFAALFPSLPATLIQNGSLRVESTLPFIGWSRIYNQSALGTYGQAVPLLDRSPARTAALARNREKRARGNAEPAPLPHAQMFPLSENSVHRTNLGLLETSGKDADVVIRIFDRNGALLRAVERHVPAGASLPLIGILRAVGLQGTDELRAELEQTGGEGSVIFSGSVIDQRSGDSVFATAD